jgi:hypothetical protein
MSNAGAKQDDGKIKVRERYGSWEALKARTAGLGDRRREAAASG